MKNEDEKQEQLSELVETLQYNIEAENFYQNVFEKAGIATVIFRKDGTISAANGEFEKLAGYKREDLEGKKKWMEFIHRKDNLEQIRGYRRFEEFQLVNRNGQIKNTAVTVSIIPGTKQTLMTLQDVTEHRRIKSDLKESMKMLVDIINFLPDATFAIDHSGKVITWNHAIEEMTGVKAEDILEKGNYEYAMVFYGVQRPLLIDLVFGFIEKIKKKYIFIKKEGNTLLAEADVPVRGIPHTLWAKAGPLYDSNGHIIGAIETVRDITYRKHMEEALRSIYSELEIKVGERSFDPAEINMGKDLERLISDIQKVISQVKILSGLLPISMSCEKISEDKSCWKRIEAYINDHS